MSMTRMTLTLWRGRPVPVAALGNCLFDYALHYNATSAPNWYEPSFEGLFVPSTGKFWQYTSSWYNDPPPGSCLIATPETGAVDGWVTGEPSDLIGVPDEMRYCPFNDCVYVLVNTYPTMTITRFSSSGAFVYRVASLENGSSLATNASNGKLYFHNTFGRIIQEVNPANGSVIGTVFTWPAGFKPVDMGVLVVTADGYIWTVGTTTSSPFHEHLRRINPADGTSVVIYTTAEAGIGGASRPIYIPASDTFIVFNGYLQKWSWVERNGTLLNYAVGPNYVPGVSGYGKHIAWNPVRGCMSMAGADAVRGIHAADFDLDSWSFIRYSPSAPAYIDWVGSSYANMVQVNPVSGDVYWTSYREYDDEPWYEYPFMRWTLNC